MKIPKLVIFDMDGTILDTEPAAASAIHKACETMGISLPQEIIHRCMGRNQAATAAILLEHFGADFDIARAFKLYLTYKAEINAKNGIPIKPGLHEILDKLDTLGIKKCVATSTDKAHAIEKLAHVNIAHRFDAIIGGDEVENGKPAPDIFLKAAAEMDIEPADCLVIEDTEAGILAATAAKIPVIAVPDIAPLSEQIRASAVAVCVDLFEVREIF
jgi:HAD superfamily hydrolase (TIGR01509 family)